MMLTANQSQNFMSTNFMSYGGQSRNKNDFNKIIIPSIAEENADFRSGN